MNAARLLISMTSVVATTPGSVPGSAVLSRSTHMNHSKNASHPPHAQAAHQANTSALAKKRPPHRLRQGRTCKRHQGDLRKMQAELQVCRWFPTTCSRCKESDITRGAHAAHMQDHLPIRALQLALLVCAAMIARRMLQAPSACSANADEPCSSGATGGWAPFTVEWLQAYVVFFLWVELSAWQAPESFTMHLPEYYLAKGLSSHPTGELFGRVRAVLLLSWLCFAAVPPRRWRRASAACFLVGAVAFEAMAIRLFAADPSHANQPAIYFVLAAAAAVVALGQENRPLADRAGAWLSNFAIVCVLAQMYLAAGMSKVRYHGLTQLFNGEWLHWAMTKGTTDILTRSPCPSLLAFVKDVDQHRVPIFSWGAAFFEVALPAVVTVMPPTARFARPVRAAFIASAIGFHVSMFAIMGANFADNVVLLLVLGAMGAQVTRRRLGAQPVLLPTEDPTLMGPTRMNPAPAPVARAEAAQTCGDRLRLVLFVLTLAGWLSNAMDADFGFALSAAFGIGKPGHKGVDRLLPFSTVSMYTNKELYPHRQGAAQSFAILLGVVLVALCCQAPVIYYVVLLVQHNDAARECLRCSTHTRVTGRCPGASEALPPLLSVCRRQQRSSDAKNDDEACIEMPQETSRDAAARGRGFGTHASHEAACQRRDP